MNRRRRGPVLALTAVVVSAVAVLITSGLQRTLVYYRTPSEVVDAPPAAGSRVRLGGEVLPGSLRHIGAADVTFRLGDGRHQVAVVQHGAPPGTFREGRDAVVEGTVDTDGVLRSDTVMVKHDNVYRQAGNSG